MTQTAEAPPGLVEIVSALIKALGKSVGTLAPQAGLLPQQGFALLAGSAWSRLRSWERAASALGAHLQVTSRAGKWRVPLTPVHQVHLDAARKTLLTRYRAAADAASSSVKIGGTIQRVRARMEVPYPRDLQVASGFAHVIQILAATKQLRAMHLSLIAGLNDVAAKRFVEGEEWPALEHVHALLTALRCSLVVTAGELTIKLQAADITALDPATLRARRATLQHRRERRLKRASKGRREKPVKPVRAARNVSLLTREEIVSFLRAGDKQTTVAGKAGISRQRVSILAREAGIGLDRRSRRLQDATQAVQALKKLSIQEPPAQR